MSKQHNTDKKGKEKFNDLQCEFIKRIIKALYDTTTVGLTTVSESDKKDSSKTVEKKYISRTAGSIAVKKNIEWFIELFSYTFKDRDIAYLDQEIKKIKFDRLKVFNNATKSINEIFGISKDDNPELWNRLPDDEMDKRGEVLYNCYCVIMRIIYKKLDDDKYRKDGRLDFEQIKDDFSYVIKNVLDIKDAESWLDKKAYDDSLRLANYSSLTYDDIEIDDNFLNLKHRVLNNNERREYTQETVKIVDKLEFVLSDSSLSRDLILNILFEGIYFFRSTILSVKMNMSFDIKEKALALFEKSYKCYFKESPSNVQDNQTIEYAHYVEYQVYLEDVLKALTLIVEEEKHERAHFL